MFLKIEGASNLGGGVLFGGYLLTEMKFFWGVYWVPLLTEVAIIWDYFKAYY